jgi:hypothetical protein
MKVIECWFTDTFAKKNRPDQFGARRTVACRPAPALRWVALRRSRAPRLRRSNVSTIVEEIGKTSGLACILHQYPE